MEFNLKNAFRSLFGDQHPAGFCNFAGLQSIDIHTAGQVCPVKTHLVASGISDLIYKQGHALTQKIVIKIVPLFVVKPEPDDIAAGNKSSGVFIV